MVPPLPEILNNPLILGAVAFAVAAVVNYQHGLTFGEYREMVRIKRRVFPVLHRIASAESTPQQFQFRSFVNDKSLPDDDAESLSTLDASARVMWRMFVDGGWSPHLVSSVKRLPDGRVSVYHFVYYHDDGKQTEAYTFRDDANWLVYSHLETVTTDVEGHLSDPQVDGDPRGVVPNEVYDG